MSFCVDIFNMFLFLLGVPESGVAGACGDSVCSVLRDCWVVSRARHCACPPALHAPATTQVLSGRSIPEV